MRDTKADKEVLLLYANNTEADIVFQRELQAMAAASPRLRVVHVLGRAGREWRGEQGFIDRAMIEKHVRGDIRNKTFYLCGPPPMMTSLINVLIDLGVPSRRIRSERFAL
jgi:ferredoxin-NADP reductase